MRPRALSVLLLLTLPNVPLASAAEGPAPLEVQGPDAEGAYLLAYGVHAEAAGPVALALQVRREDGAGVETSARDAGTWDLSPGQNRVEVPFLPSEGPGEYAVSLVATGAEGGPLVFRVEEGGGAAARFAFSVPDEPTELALTTDPVNAEGKSKSPGEAVVTRALLRDANGVAEVDEVRALVEREGVLVESGPVPFSAQPDATSVPLEARWARSPAAEGAYRMAIVAFKDGAPVANVSRGFVVKEVASVLAGGNLTPVLAGRAARMSTEALVADRNGAPGPLEARVYKASTRMEEQGFQARLGAPAPRPDVDGHARTAYPLEVVVPETGAAGLYRVSLYSGATLVGSLPFELRRAPNLTEVRAEAAPGGALRLVALGTGEGHLVAEDAEGAAPPVSAPFAAGRGEALLAPPTPGPLRWRLRLLVAEGGETVETREGLWTPVAAPALTLTPRHVSPRLPASWQLAAPGWDLAQALARVEVLRWDGAPAPGVAARLDGDVLRVLGPADLMTGRYDARLRLDFPNGTWAEASWSFEAGPFVRLRAGEPVVDSREARIPIHNDGGLPVRRLVAEVDPGVAHATLTVGGQTLEPRAGARRVFSGFELAPGASAEMTLRLPPGPLPAGGVEARVRLLALPGGA